MLSVNTMKTKMTRSVVGGRLSFIVFSHLLGLLSHFIVFFLLFLCIQYTLEWLTRLSIFVFLVFRFFGEMYNVLWSIHNEISFDKTKMLGRLVIFVVIVADISSWFNFIFTFTVSFWFSCVFFLFFLSWIDKIIKWFQSFYFVSFYLWLNFIKCNCPRSVGGFFDDRTLWFYIEFKKDFEKKI